MKSIQQQINTELENTFTEKAILNVRWFGRETYIKSWQRMRNFTDSRKENTTDECWLGEHEPVFTQGQNGQSEHILNPGEIPVVQTDRGGQITYHGPGQLMVYFLIDLKRKKMSIRKFVSSLEISVIDFLASYQITAYAKPSAPGVYIDVRSDVKIKSNQSLKIQTKKICSIGLRVRRGCSYHGIAFNINMDLEPFNRINPCGFSSLKMTQLAEFVDKCDLLNTGQNLVNYLIRNLGYTSANFLSH